MKIDVIYTAGEETVRPNQTVIVIDVLRASTTMVTALANGSPAIYAEESVEAALKRAEAEGDILLCGERQGRKIESFDLGNSPLEYSAESIRGRVLVLTTSNGTRALKRVGQRNTALVGSFINFNAVLNRALQLKQNITFLCAGDEGKFSYEDTLCAALMVQHMEQRSDSVSLSDAARHAGKALQGKARFSNDELEALLRQTPHGQHLIRLGFAEDITYCAKMNRFDVVPVLKGDKLVI